MKNVTRQQSSCRVLRFRTSPEGKDARISYAGFKFRLLQVNLPILVLAIVTWVVTWKITIWYCFRRTQRQATNKV